MTRCLGWMPPLASRKSRSTVAVDTSSSQLRTSLARKERARPPGRHRRSKGSSCSRPRGRCEFWRVHRRSISSTVMSAEGTAPVRLLRPTDALDALDGLLRARRRVECGATRPRLRGISHGAFGIAIGPTDMPTGCVEQSDVCRVPLEARS